MPKIRVKQEYIVKSDLVAEPQMIEIKEKDSKLYKEIIKIYDHFDGKTELELDTYVDAILNKLFAMSSTITGSEALIPLSFLNTKLGRFLMQAKVTGSPKKVLGVSEVLKMINESPNVTKAYTRMSVYDWANKGDLKNYKTDNGGRYFYEEDVLLFMKNRKFI